MARRFASILLRPACRALALTACLLGPCATPQAVAQVRSAAIGVVAVVLESCRFAAPESAQPGQAAASLRTECSRPVPPVTREVIVKAAELASPAVSAIRANGVEPGATWLRLDVEH